MRDAGRVAGVVLAVLAASGMSLAQRPSEGPFLMAQRRQAPLRQRGPQMMPPQRSAHPQAVPEEGQPLPPHRGPHAGQWLRNILGLPVKEQTKALEMDPQFQQLPPDRQQKLRERLMQFNSLSPDQQQRILNRMDRFGHLSPEQQHEARQLFRQFRGLAPERKKVVMDAYHALRSVKQEDREQTLNSAPFQGLTSDERVLVKGFADLDFAPRSADRQDDGDDNPPQQP